MTHVDTKNQESPRRRRNRQYIIAEILKVAKDGVPKTQIMYGANLSFAQLGAYVSLLVKLKLLEAVKRDEKTIYKTTSRGFEYLESYEEIRRLLREEGKRRIRVCSNSYKLF